MKLFSITGICASGREPEEQREGLFLLAFSYLLLWLFITIGIFFFLNMTLHNIGLSFIFTFLFGFVQYCIINLMNSSVRISIIDFHVYTQKEAEFTKNNKYWESKTDEQKKNTAKPIPPSKPKPSILAPTLFFCILCVLSGVSWGIFTSTSYIIVNPVDPEEYIVQEIFTRVNLALENRAILFGSCLGALLSFIPSVIFKVTHADNCNDFFLEKAKEEYAGIYEDFNKHKKNLQRVLPVAFLSESSFEDPPFNTKPKIMGWIRASVVTNLEVPPQTSIPKKESKTTELSSEN